MDYVCELSSFFVLYDALMMHVMCMLLHMMWIG